MITLIVAVLLAVSTAYLGYCAGGKIARGSDWDKVIADGVKFACDAVSKGVRFAWRTVSGLWRNSEKTPEDLDDPEDPEDLENQEDHMTR